MRCLPCARQGGYIPKRTRNGSTFAGRLVLSIEINTKGANLQNLNIER
jgi:hypothetical protein